ncbi:MAG TPA: MltA domain-containing protein [Caulobacteraceae bacterium]|nr:MltA domain-containing protein [Caulobacteraceae bacterium]
MLRRVLAAVLAAVSLAACATVRPTAPVARATGPARPAASRAPFATPAPLYIAPPYRSSGTFAALPGWAEDDHAGAFAAFAAGCRAARDPALVAACDEAIAASPLGETDARQFFETRFRPERLGATGLLTAYFTPLYEARRQRDGEFTEPVRPRPGDLPRQAAAGGAAVYPDRAEIDRWPAADALAWMRPEDLLFLQIQGSGVLAFPEGERWRAVFDGANGAAFVGLAAPMRRLGLLDRDTSGERIRAWLADHRGPEAQSVIEMDPRYVFFRLEADDGGEPAGAAGYRLVPGRALAVDPALHSMGELLWVDASAPALPGAFPRYRRLAMALDTGSAIKGGVRADLYLGRGPEAGIEAGRVRHLLTLYRLVPVATPPDRLAALIPPGS